MLGELVRFEVVLGVIMMGVTVAFYVLSWTA